jgi:DNA recombination protein RmuC
MATVDPLIGVLIGVVLGGAVAAAVAMRWVVRASSHQAALEASLEAARASHADLRDTFAALSHEALRQNRTDFLQNAGDVLQPIRETLGKVQDHLAVVDKAREGSFQAVSSHLAQLATAQKELREAAEGLTRALKSPNTRGRWGEIQLRRIVELAGMTSQCDFIEKPVAESDSGGRQSPDLVIRLPGNASIVVDAKVPIDAYLAAGESRSEGDRRQRLLLHARQVRDHIRTLGAKEYWKQFDASPEFVVMFLPIEPLLAAALEEDAELLDQAAALRVIPATPLTLLALLKAAALGWRQQDVARNAEEIQQLGRELYERLDTMVEHLENLGRNIKLAGDSYDRLVGSLEQKVLPGARRFKELGVQTARELEIVDPLRLTIRKVSKPELTGRPDEASPDTRSGTDDA